MQIIEVEEVPVGASDVTTVAAVEAYAAYLNGVWGSSDGVEHRIRIKRIQAVCDIEVVADVCVGVVGIPIPRFSIDIGLVQLAAILATEVCYRYSARVTSIDLREGGRDYLAGADTHAGLAP